MFDKIFAGAPDQMLRLALLLGLGSNGQNTVSLVGNSSSIGRRSPSIATGTQICHNPGMAFMFTP